VLLDYTTADLKGKFEFTNISNSQIIIKVTYLGYLPKLVAASLLDKKVNVGKIILQEMASELLEVVIKAAKASIKIKGDTIEYDISQFVVPDGSTLADLLKKLPGLFVLSDGTIMVEGREVSKLTVDGKVFFTEDPKLAMSTLPAEAISKVQVYDHKTEESLITGKSSQNDGKEINVELKEEFKKIHFGKIAVGVGSESRRELKGNFNKFGDKNQFSIILTSHNTTKNIFSLEDRVDFFGSSSKVSYGGYEYGFGGLGSNTTSSLERRISEGLFSVNKTGFPYTILRYKFQAATFPKSSILRLSSILFCNSGAIS